VAISLGGLAVGIVVALVACTVFLVPLWQAMACYALGAFYLLAFPWACLEWGTRNRAVRAHNRFVYFVIATLIVTLVMQWGTEKRPFPTWAVAASVLVGIAAYSVMAYYAVVNFGKWRRGNYEDINNEKA
jgi:hypothetical protein